MAKMGRPSKLTTRLQERILRRIELGEAPRRACINCGLGASRYSAWAKRATAGEQPYADFYQDIERAEEGVKAEAETLIRKAFTGIEIKKLRQRFSMSEDTGEMELVEETIETTTKIYPQFALTWLERKAKREWAPTLPAPSPVESPSPPQVTAGGETTYSDEWLESDDNITADAARAEEAEEAEDSDG